MFYDSVFWFWHLEFVVSETEKLKLNFKILVIQIANNSVNCYYWSLLLLVISHTVLFTLVVLELHETAVMLVVHMSHCKSPVSRQVVSPVKLSSLIMNKK